ncbi:MAG TPA: alpha/beta hydrolase [Thermoanaerobaculia bacterium]|nr:alpha/beta hydrolase [Thermoanaerobaculia bacterium]
MKIRWQTIRKVWATTGAILFVVFTLWNLISYQSWGVDEAVLRSDGRVSVEPRPGYTAFLPRAGARPVGLVFYPGALVDPEAYAPLARTVAESGYPVFLLELPLRLAPSLSSEVEVYSRTLSIMKRETAVRRWIVGGHSKGGAIACRFAVRNTRSPYGLLLVGSSHPREIDMSDLPFEVTKIYATRDGLASEEEVRHYARNLPEDTHWVRIEGGNHCQFGWYGFQFGDRPAAISRARQQDLLAAAVIDALRRAEVEPEGEPMSTGGAY